MKRKVIFYFDELYTIGGIETWIYNLTSAIKNDFDILVLWGKYANQVQLDRLPVESEKYVQGKKYTCDVLVNVINGRPNSIQAGHIIQVIHANYRELPPQTKYTHWNRVDSFVFVSEAAKSGFTYPLRGMEAPVIENPLAKPKVINQDFTAKPLKLMAATRLSEEKGGERMVKLAKALTKANIPFVFDVWTTWTKAKFNSIYPLENTLSSFRFHEPQLDLTGPMLDATYVCQFSDCESFCYTIYEALNMHVPVLVTDWKGVRKAVRNRLNGYIFNMEMDNIDPRRLLTVPHTFGVLPDSARAWKKHLNEVPILHQFPQPYNYFLK